MGHILIIEDDDNFFAVLDTVAQRMGHTVARAASVDQIKSAANPTPNLVISDMQFPGGGAPAAVKMIQGMPALADVPMIFCTSMPQDQVKSWFPETPKRRYHRKPADLKLMSEDIAALMPASKTPNVPGAPAKEGVFTGSQLSLLFEAEKGKKLSESAASEASTRLTNALLVDAVRARASDIHLEPYGNDVLVRYRIDGMMRNQATFARNSNMIINRLRIMSNLPPSASANPMPEDSSFSIPEIGREVRVRISVYPSGYGDKIVMRILDLSQATQSLDNLGFLPHDSTRLKGMIHRKGGLFLISGGTGSGKTTTLCSILETLSRQDITISTLEDPIEYQLPRVVHTQINSKSGLTFAVGLRAMLRQDPNVLMLGEVRDRETAEVAFQAAMTGHSIFSTIHATNASGVVARLLGMEVEPYMIGSFLIGALAQKLVRRVCSHCTQPAVPDPRLLDAYVKSLEPAVATLVKDLLAAPGAKFASGKGCAVCFGSGFQGRIGIYELLNMDSAMSAMVPNKPSSDQILNSALNAGMRPLAYDAVAKARAGWTTMEECAKVLGLAGGFTPAPAA